MASIPEKPTPPQTESKNRIANQAPNPPYYQHLHPPFRRLWDDCDLINIYPASERAYRCASISDIDYAKLGILRCISHAKIGQEFLQHHADKGQADIDPGHFFKALRSAKAARIAAVWGCWMADFSTPIRQNQTLAPRPPLRYPLRPPMNEQIASIQTAALELIAAASDVRGLEDARLLGICFLCEGR